MRSISSGETPVMQLKFPYFLSDDTPMPKKYTAPENAAKNEILQWLSMRQDCMCWPNDSTGIFDPIKKIYRKKNSKFFRKGVSDILGIFNHGALIAIEVKSETGRLSPEQRIFLADITSRNGLALVARNYQDVELAFEEYYKKWKCSGQR